MDYPYGAEHGSTKETEAPLEVDLFKYELEDMDVFEDVEVDLQVFVRLARLGLFDEASRRFERYLARHQSIFSVLVENLDMLLQASRYQDVIINIEKEEGLRRNPTTHDETDPDGQSQLLAAMKVLAKVHLDMLEEDALLAELEDCRGYLERKWPRDTREYSDAILIHLAEVYLGIVTAGLEFRLIREQYRLRYCNPPWTTEETPEWYGFCTWYKELMEIGCHWEAQRIQRMLIPKVTFDQAEKTIIQIDLQKVIKDAKETGDYDEPFVLSMLAISNNVCDYLLKEAAKSRAQLANLASDYLAISRSLKAELCQNSTLDIINRSLPVKQVDELELKLKDTKQKTAETQTRTPSAKGIARYGVWKATPVRYNVEDPHLDWVSPHLQLFVHDKGGQEALAAVDIKSENRDSRLVYLITSDFTHHITEKLAQLDPGFHVLTGTLEQKLDGLALDFIRSNLFDPTNGRILSHDIDNTGHDMLDQLRPILDRAISQKSRVYIYGSQFSDGTGIHDIHMNQGNAGRWGRENGVFQDGALIFEFVDHWEAVFIGFASQAVQTEDGPGLAGHPLQQQDFMTWADLLAPDKGVPGLEPNDSSVVITQALVNPRGSDQQPGVPKQTISLKNRTSYEVDLTGWQIRNMMGQAQRLPSNFHIGPSASMTIEVHIPISNQGGTISLLNRQGLVQHGVSYTKVEADRATVVFE
ncbi:yukJ [Fusarium beomiforme]|uniref:YukJ n=1 Tax=Fusarium beomiforme TaxID=44412 RepID=A0A9P5AJU2_9HYPO|nr:yukJ [Fusarium beomiforme]